MYRHIIALPFLLMLIGCQSISHPPLPTVKQLDISRFMGDWYVIAAIPTAIERESYNAIESYRLSDNGVIETTFTFLDKGFDGKVKRYHASGRVKDTTSNAVWNMQFFWPFNADYRVMYLSPDYSTTIVGRLRRDYVWIMARSPALDDNEYQRLVRVVAGAGYDTDKLRVVPQQWPGNKI